jgi:hypothetical protein
MCNVYYIKEKVYDWLLFCVLFEGDGFRSRLRHIIWYDVRLQRNRGENNGKKYKSLYKK